MAKGLRTSVPDWSNLAPNPMRNLTALWTAVPSRSNSASNPCYKELDGVVDHRRRPQGRLVQFGIKPCLAVLWTTGCGDRAGWPDSPSNAMRNLTALWTKPSPPKWPGGDRPAQFAIKCYKELGGIVDHSAEPVPFAIKSYKELGGVVDHLPRRQGRLVQFAIKSCKELGCVVDHRSRRQQAGPIRHQIL